MICANHLLIAPALLVAASCQRETSSPPTTMKLSAPALATAASIPAQFNCDGADLSPELSWSDPPTGTRSFVVILDDPDAPGGTFGHWAIFDIAPSVHHLAAGAGNNAVPGPRQARNDFGSGGYRGPCPPRGKGAHRYRFRLLALKVDHLYAPGAPNVADVERAARRQVLGTATLIAKYARE